jgi:hypothetical protein
LRLLLRDDVDDARDGVGAVLGRGAFGEHFDVIDRVDRDEVEIDAGTALVRAAEDREAGRRVAALAVDQHQRVVR